MASRKQLLYTDFLWLILDYFDILELRSAIYEWIFPLFITIFLYICIPLPDIETWSSLQSNTLSLLGILVGFAIASITILATSSSNNIKEIKSFYIKKDGQEKVIGGHKVSLFMYMLINLSYGAIVKIRLIIGNLLALIIPSDMSAGALKVLYTIYVFLLLHVLLLTLRNTTSFYHILFKNKQNDS